MVTTCYASAAASPTLQQRNARCVSRPAHLTAFRRIEFLGAVGWPLASRLNHWLRSRVSFHWHESELRPDSPNSFSTSRMAADNNGLLFQSCPGKSRDVEKHLRKKDNPPQSWGRPACRYERRPAVLVKRSPNRLRWVLVHSASKWPEPHRPESSGVSSNSSKTAVTHLARSQPDATLLLTRPQPPCSSSMYRQPWHVLVRPIRSAAIR